MLCIIESWVRFAVESMERGRCDQIIDIYYIVCVAIAVLPALKVNITILILFSKLKGGYFSLIPLKIHT